MKTIVDNETGELIEVEEKNELVEKELMPLITDDFIEKLVELDYLKEQIETYQFSIKEKIKDVFKKYGVKSCETDFLTISYVPEFMKKSIDSERLKDDGLYEKYIKFTPVKESIRFSLKGKND